MVNVAQVASVHPDCDRDSLIYLGEPIGPSCHTGAPTCWFERLGLDESGVSSCGHHESAEGRPRSALLELEATIEARKRDAESGDGAPLLRTSTEWWRRCAVSRMSRNTHSTDPTEQRAPKPPQCRRHGSHSG